MTLPKGPWTLYEHSYNMTNQYFIIKDGAGTEILHVFGTAQGDRGTEHIGLVHAVLALPALIEAARDVLEAEEYGNSKLDALEKFRAALRIVDDE